MFYWPLKEWMWVGSSAVLIRLIMFQSVRSFSVAANYWLSVMTYSMKKKMNCSLWCQQQARAWWSVENRLTTTWQEPWTIDWNLLGLWWWGEIIYCYYTSVQVNNNSPVNTKYLVIWVYWLGCSLTWCIKKWDYKKV